ncbi:MAG: Methionyl-tRNA formyltransferase [Candidatus Falkowbacteria bacterium GW2011_GWC2_38_22]|uniref:Methionyl-tRNA formyltransferase n=1 Tax=Candidatus Falkowbacteria bacterium GW2011_GWE1_38_31 TaxID=1618638 RepID=A0A0G0M7U3_9BACT|nr:MAG: Methionyl-tRNA formyltransferase [Candidatus Falkowbacteria bacterium GW2011_GWF2_38_1205]KKQ60811.1 MAG: Methionyl-tRNA formyltransferase [Candidatus Falkowbacteria bacterium GW2011_GWC2_38_22]KKQ62978.1 MAG: Methionyl-tRNA formyltransferase [Candidatus Falkowbacteria bacterium GW2011_GWF1_38_22]KKQ64990.1 MAG: Methionyl-tRNA formyltransferase [Candidatus Falkowbacteria bacterium GW2011_GWE2_38_254]KKQ69754.1 MAG: Methionyl-tRNA formyltransferase [Candidatus Falkowbacteria bacterium GW
MPQKIKTIFIGTPDFGAPSLINLINDDSFDIVSIITQPDKKIGRKQELTSPIIKQVALEHNLPVLQPQKIKDITEQIKQLSPDLIIVIAYAQIIPGVILNIPKYGTINVHGSLLPKYRGASCIQATILNGDKETGVTIMKMDENLDTGPILSQKEITIIDSDTSKTLFEKLSILGADILIPTIKDYIDNKIQAIPQDDSKSSYVGMLKKEDGHINWNQPADKIERFIRAMHSWPGAFFNYQLRIKNYELKIIKTSNIFLNTNNHKPGEIFTYNKKLFIMCRDKAIEILELQLSGKGQISAQSFLNGYSKYLINTNL